MKFFSFSLTAIAAGVIVYVLYNLAMGYMAASGTTWQRLLAAERSSATILVQKLGLLVSALGFGANGLIDVTATLFNDQAFADNAKATVQSALTPTTAGIGVAVFCALTIWARLRTLGKS